jgi:hypothetical protein
MGSLSEQQAGTTLSKERARAEIAKAAWKPQRNVGAGVKVDLPPIAGQMHPLAKLAGQNPELVRLMQQLVK